MENYIKPKFISIKELYPDLSKYVPGWIKGTYYCITGSTGSGKSKFARYSFANWTYTYCKANNIPFKVIYFALEETVEFFWTTILLDKFREKTGKKLNYNQFKGYEDGMTKEDWLEIQSLKPETDDMKKYIIVYDSVSNPTGLLRSVEKELQDVGTIIKGETIKDDYGNEITKKEFKYNDPDFHLVVIADHIGLLASENNEFAQVTNLHQAITKWSEYVIKILCKRFNAIVVSVHQQQASGENNDNFKLGRLEPSETKLGDNLLVSRDYMVTIGLFNPAKYKIPKYLEYNIRELDDNFRSVHIIKHRTGVAGLAKAMWFDGAGNKFIELPKPNTPELTQFINKLKEK